MLNNSAMFPIWQGRFQPFHLGHYFVAKKVLEKYGRVLFSIVVPDPKRYPEHYEKFHPSINPFTYFERCEMIYRSFEMEGIDTCGRIAICPMWGLATAYEREKPYYPNPSQRMFIMTQIREDNHPKIKMIKDWGGKVEVFREIPMEISGIDATTIRDRICNFEDWRHLVPKGTLSVIDEFDLEKRIRETSALGW